MHSRDTHNVVELRGAERHVRRLVLDGKFSLDLLVLRDLAEDLLHARRHVDLAGLERAAAGALARQHLELIVEALLLCVDLGLRLEARAALDVLLIVVLVVAAALATLLGLGLHVLRVLLLLELLEELALQLRAVKGGLDLRLARLARALLVLLDLLLGDGDRLEQRRQVARPVVLLGRVRLADLVGRAPREHLLALLVAVIRDREELGRMSEQAGQSEAADSPSPRGAAARAG